MRKPAMITKAFQWLKRHKADAAITVVLLAAGGTVSAINMAGYPQRFEDEGTYISQAWSVKEEGALAHYTYWYDHPPVGWIQIAAYLVISNGLDRYGSAITAGREFMLVMHLATIGLLYALARRLAIGRISAAIGTLLYALSPLSVEFSRYVLLDNVALPWLIGAFLLALSPRRSLLTAIGAAVCMAIAVMSKETLLVLLPVVLYGLWYTGDTRNRRYTLTAFSVVFGMICAAYILYAALKNELFPGAGHVSLLGTLFWQLFGREGSGSIIDPNSGTYGLVKYWLNIDYFLIAAGALGLLPSLFIRSLRSVGFALLISFAMLLRTGYLPFPYIIALLPFAALCFAGAFDRLIIMPLTRRGVWIPFRLAAGIALVELLIILVFIIAPMWQPKLATAMIVDADASSRQAVAWMAANIPRSSRLVVESGLWADLEERGFDQPKPVWLYKTETDPAVKSEIGGWQGVDYIVLNGPTIGARNFDTSFPTVSTGIKNSKLATEFGSGNQKILIYRVDKN